jgi:hypothetical protein
MKSYKNFFIAATAGMLLLSSCSDFLDKVPREILSKHFPGDCRPGFAATNACYNTPKLVLSPGGYPIRHHER